MERFWAYRERRNDGLFSRWLALLQCRISQFVDILLDMKPYTRIAVLILFVFQVGFPSRLADFVFGQDFLNGFLFDKTLISHRVRVAAAVFEATALS